MKKELMRIGTDKFVNESSLDRNYAFDLIFGSYNYEFVYIPDYYPWQRVNGTWTGVLDHLMNDIQMDLKQSCFQGAWSGKMLQTFHNSNMFSLQNGIFHYTQVHLFCGLRIDQRRIQRIKARSLQNNSESQNNCKTECFAELFCRRVLLALIL